MSDRNDEAILKQIRTKKAYGVYDGYVTDIDDPVDRCRVKAGVPELLGPDGETFWALPRGVGNSATIGINLYPPEVGDHVFVSFVGGNLETPIYEFGTTTTEGNRFPKGIRYIKSKKFKIELDDDNDTLRISSADEKVGLLIDNSTKNISLFGIDFIFNALKGFFVNSITAVIKGRSVKNTKKEI